MIDWLVASENDEVFVVMVPNSSVVAALALPAVDRETAATVPVATARAVRTAVLRMEMRSSRGSGRRPDRRRAFPGGGHKSSGLDAGLRSTDRPT